MTRAAPTAVILQHQDDAPPGLLLDALQARGVTAATVHLDRGDRPPDPRSVSFAVTLGSEASAEDTQHEWVASEIAWLRAAQRAGTAILGLCFGAQALAVALGGGVARARRPERGWVWVATREPDLISPGPWLSWHDDVIHLPPGAELLAHNDRGPQAYRHGAHLGVQFHPEVTPEIVASWVAQQHEDDPEYFAEFAGDVAEARYRAAAAGALALFGAFISSVVADG